MAPYKKGNRKVARRYKKKQPYVKRAIRRANSGVFKKRVLNVIRGQNETKQAFHNMASTDFNSGISGAGDALRIVPNIAQGTDGHQRVGDVITPQSLNLRMILQMLPQGANQSQSYCKIGCRVMIVSPKSFPTWASASANTASWMPFILKKGGTVTSFTGDVSDLFAPTNTDVITTHWNKVYYFNQPWASSSTGMAAFDQSHLVRFVNKTIKFGSTKKFKYDANIDAGLTPSNGNAYVMLIGYCFVDGSSPDTLSVRIRAQYDCILNYEDA